MDRIDRAGFLELGFRAAVLGLFLVGSLTALLPNS